MLNIKQIVEATKGKLRNGNPNYIVKDYVLDSRIIKQDDFFIPIVGNNSNAHDYILNCIENGASGYFIQESEKDKENIISKSIQINKDVCIVEIFNSQDALYEIGKFNRGLHMDIPVIAVTGSVGKTSTREMISSILSQKYNVLTTYKNYNGYIGLPLMLLKLENQQLAVLEHGIDYIGEMDMLVAASKPNVSVVTMIGTAHIGIFGSQDNIFTEKLKVTKNMQNGASVILNGDDNYLSTYTNTTLNVIKYSMNDVNNVESEEEITYFKTKINNIEEQVKLNQIGQHNIYNALAGIKVAELFNVETDKIIKGIEEYKNQASRFEKIVLKNNIEIIDDTYNASIDSMKSGIKTISIMNAKRKIIVLGDMFELGNYSENLHLEVGKLFNVIKVDFLFTLGDNSKVIAKEANRYLKNVYEFDNRLDLIKELLNVIQDGDLIYFKASNAMKFNEIIQEVKKHIELK